MKKYIPFSLRIKIKNRIYQFAEVSFNQNTEEIFYAFFKKDSRLKHTIYGESKFGLRSGPFNTGEPEHISFHNDGTIHVKSKRYQSLARHYWKTHTLPMNIFDFVNLNGPCPVLIDSFFCVKNEYDIKELEHNNLEVSVIDEEII